MLSFDPCHFKAAGILSGALSAVTVTLGPALKHLCVVDTFVTYLMVIAALPLFIIGGIEMCQDSLLIGQIAVGLVVTLVASGLLSSNP